MGYLFLTLALLFNATANILLKVGATRLGPIEGPGLVARVAGDGYLLAGVLLFALNVVLYTAALTRLDLSVAYPIMVAGGIVIVVSVSTLVLRETVTVVQSIGLVLLVLGIALVGQRSFA
jgi:multidrug transporter EmrE-like cation transporter